METQPHIIETALLLLIAFAIGCGIGWLVRVRLFGPPSAPARPDPVTPPAEPLEADEPKTAGIEVPAAAAEPAAPKPAKSTARKSSTAKPKAAKPKTTASKPAAAAPSDDAGKPKGLEAPREGGKDDLKKISGVGPKIEGLLNGLGIYHYDQIVGWDRQTIDWVDNYLSFKGRIDRDKWLDQARDFTKK